jgi:hypothetical protein
LSRPITVNLPRTIRSNGLTTPSHRLRYCDAASLRVAGRPARRIRSSLPLAV